MASTPPGTPPQLPLPAFGKSLRISPNLEALLQHDELTRRTTGSLTTSYDSPTSRTPGLASLPPPPPRYVPAGRKGGLHEARAKDVQRKKSVNIRSDSWPDALPVFTSERLIGQHGPSSSRSATSNPYINPTPTVRPVDAARPPQVDDGIETPTSNGMILESSFPNAEGYCHSSTTDVQHHSPASTRSSPAMHRVEKILSRGRESLNLFTGTAVPGVSRPRSDAPDRGQRSTRTEYVTPSANNSAELGSSAPQEHAAVSRRPSHQSSVRGDRHTAPTASSPRVVAGTQPSQQSSRPAERHPDTLASLLSEASSTRSPSIYSQSSYPYTDGDTIRTYPKSSQPHLPLLSMSSNQPPQLRPVERVTADDQSFIDFFTPSSSDDTTYNDENNLDDMTPSHSHLQLPAVTIPPSSIYTTSSHSISSTSLATMTFALPSPGDLSSPINARPDSPSASSIALSGMVFAPPSPITEVPAGQFPQPDSPCSSNSSLTSIEFAPPRSPVPNDSDKSSIVSKLNFGRGRSLRVDRRSASVSPRPSRHLVSPLPPTTNLLDASERADLIRRNRKLTQLLGQTPHAEGIPEETRLFKRLPPPALTPFLGATKQRPHRHAVSVSVSVKGPAIKTEPSTPWQIDDSWSPGGRRHSIPLTPSSFTFYLDDEPNGALANNRRGLHSLAEPQNPRESPTSFIDLSDEEVTRDDVSAISSIDVRMGNKRQFFHHFSSTPSLVESLDTEEQAEAERKRKRDKLAKLHRFLGSRVPPDLVVNAVTGSSLEPSNMRDEITRDNRLRGRRAGSLKPIEHFDRRREELDEREKALNVRRAQKMERVFGTPPPQTLFHTRQGRSTLVHSQPNTPTVPCTTTPFIFSVDAPTNTRNFNQSAYKGKRTHRPGTSDSSKHLLPSEETEDSPSSSTGLLSGYQDVLAQSSVYLNYQHSLNSLTDIIDRDDRESLVELHRFLHSDVVESPAEEQQLPESGRRISIASSFKSERRHSLPTTASLTSLSSEQSMLSPRPELSEFQRRRRRAAKLTHFFGVDYRELIHDVLESIEKGVEEERRRGTLQPEEVEVLLHRVRSLRTKQDHSSKF